MSSMGEGGHGIVCVLGMSRSGTSLTARILNLGGVYLGPEDEMLWHRASNAEGHWENHAMLRFNEWLLKSLGGSWREPPSMPAGWEAGEALAAERRTAAAFLERTFGGYPLWGWKDPRNSLTLPFWQTLLRDLRYVICLRNPIDVAASLALRDGIAAEDAFALWLTYTNAALANTEGRERLVVAYEDYFGDWRAPVERLAGFAGLPALGGGAAEAGVEATIKDGLRHHRTPPEVVLEDERVPPSVASTYLRLLPQAAAEQAR